MLAVENYLAEMKLNESRSLVTPSAPLDEASTSNQDFVQNINMIECVVCLDLQVSIFSLIYLSLNIFFTLCKIWGCVHYLLLHIYSFSICFASYFSTYSAKWSSYPADTSAVALLARIRFLRSVRCAEVQ